MTRSRSSNHNPLARPATVRRWLAGLPGLADLPREFQGGEGLDAETVVRLATGRQVGLDRQLLERLLRESGGNRSKTARMLAIGRTTLWRRLKAPQAPASSPAATPAPVDARHG